MYSHILTAVDGSAGASRAFGSRLRSVRAVGAGWLPLGPELALDVNRLAHARRADSDRWPTESRAKCGSRSCGFTADAARIQSCVSGLSLNT